MGNSYVATACASFRNVCTNLPWINSKIDIIKNILANILIVDLHICQLFQHFALSSIVLYTKKTIRYVITIVLLQYQKYIVLAGRSGGSLLTFYQHVTLIKYSDSRVH